MKFTSMPLSGAYLIDLEKHEDNRGFLARTWCEKEFSHMGLDTTFSQMNSTMSIRKGTLRGLHFQRSPTAETKIVRCIRGAIWDVVVDLRAGSSTFGKWYGVELNEDNRTMVYVPKGFAHGIQTLTDNVEQLYLHSEFHSPDHEGGLRYNDPSVLVEWPLPVSVISHRDLNHPFLNELEPVIV